jgi:low affinity Fe/Cu permease
MIHGSRFTMLEKLYGLFANRVSDFIGSVWSLLILLVAIVATGLYFEFSPHWESRLHIAMAFLALVAVFFLQRSQRHDDKAINLKLDELIKAAEGARNHVAEVNKESDEVLDHVSKNKPTN